MIKRLMIKKKTRTIDKCSGCDMYKYCGLRMKGTHMKNYKCHSKFDLFLKAIKNYDLMVRKTMRLRNASYTRASYLVKKWIRLKVINLPAHLKNEFNPYKMTSEECRFFIEMSNEYLN